MPTRAIYVHGWAQQLDRSPSKLYIYIYIVCVCVCVCVYKRTRTQAKGGLEERDVLAIALAPAAPASVFVLLY